MDVSRKFKANQDKKNTQSKLGTNEFCMTNRSKCLSISQDINQTTKIERLTDKQKKVLKTLLVLSHGFGYCFQSNELIANSLKISIRAFQRILVKLESIKAISREINFGRIECPRKIFISKTYKEYFEKSQKVTCQKTSKKNDKIIKMSCQKTKIFPVKVTCQTKTKIKKIKEKTKQTCHSLGEKISCIPNKNNIYIYNNNLDDDAGARENKNYFQKQKEKNSDQPIVFFTPRGLKFTISRSQIREHLADLPEFAIQKTIKKFCYRVQFTAVTDPLSYVRTICENYVSSEVKRSSLPKIKNKSENKKLMRISKLQEFKAEKLKSVQERFLEILESKNLKFKNPNTLAELYPQKLKNPKELDPRMALIQQFEKETGLKYEF